MLMWTFLYINTVFVRFFRILKSPGSKPDVSYYDGAFSLISLVTSSKFWDSTVKQVVTSAPFLRQHSVS